MPSALAWHFFAGRFYNPFAWQGLMDGQACPCSANIRMRWMRSAYPPYDLMCWKVIGCIPKAGWIRSLRRIHQQPVNSNGYNFTRSTIHLRLYDTFFIIEQKLRQDRGPGKNPWCGPQRRQAQCGPPVIHPKESTDRTQDSWGLELILFMHLSIPSASQRSTARPARAS